MKPWNVKVCRSFVRIASQNFLGAATDSNPGDKLSGLWGTYYAILWNSQQFGIRLAYLTLQQNFLLHGRTILQRLLVRLKNSTADFTKARDAGCMVAFLAFGMASMGIGAFGAWSTVVGSSQRHFCKKITVLARIEDLKESFPRLADI